MSSEIRKGVYVYAHSIERGAEWQTNTSSLPCWWAR